MRLLLSLAAALVVGMGAAVAVALLYAIAELYLAGHNLEPRWFGAAANTIFLILAGGGSIASFVLVWRSLGRSRRSRAPG